MKGDRAYALTLLCIHSLCTESVCRMCRQAAMCDVMRLKICFKFYDDISMLFHSLTFVILCGSEFSSILQKRLCFFENFSCLTSLQMSVPSAKPVNTIWDKSEETVFKWPIRAILRQIFSYPHLIFWEKVRKWCRLPRGPRGWMNKLFIKGTVSWRNRGFFSALSLRHCTQIPELIHSKSLGALAIA
jgi:hypothetical protein